jgi:hypothetical protein
MDIGNSIVAGASRLLASGYTPQFVGPSNVSMAEAIVYFDQIVGVPGAVQHLAEFSYHRYSGVSQANLQAIADRATQYGVDTAMLEHIGSGYEDLHQDLKIARNSAWEQFALAFCTNDNGAQYFWIDESNPNNPVVNMGSRTKFLRQYFKFIRKGATRIEASTDDNDFDPLAFINTDGSYVVVVKASQGGAFAVRGLPAGSYGIKYTTNSQYNIDYDDITINSGQDIDTSIPASGVLTIYGKDASQPTPSPTTTTPGPSTNTPTPDYEYKVNLPILLKTIQRSPQIGILNKARPDVNCIRTPSP